MSYVDNVERKTMGLATYCSNYVTAFVKHNKNLPKIVKEKIVEAQKGDTTALKWMLAFARRVAGIEKTAAEYSVSRRTFVENMNLDDSKFEVLKLKPETVADGKKPSWGPLDDDEHDVVRGEYEGAACSNNEDAITMQVLEGDSVVRDKRHGHCADSESLREWVKFKGVEATHPGNQVRLFTGLLGDTDENAYRLFMLSVACMALAGGATVVTGLLNDQYVQSQQRFGEVFRGETDLNFQNALVELTWQGAQLGLSFTGSLVGAGGAVLSIVAGNVHDAERRNMQRRMRGGEDNFLMYSMETLTAALENWTPRF